MNSEIYQTLIKVEALSQHIQNPKWAIVDCRFDLAKPDSGFSSYVEAHIPGSVYAHTNRDLSGPVSPRSGRHPLPSLDAMVSTFSRWGIDQDTQVVAYDASGGAYAARLWWLLRYAGHNQVAVLDGGFPAWVNAGYPTSSGEEHRQPAVFSAHFRPEMIVDADEVDRLRSDPAYRLIDARAPERFSGSVEPIDAVAGHIPGAANHFYGKNLHPDGTFRNPDDLRNMFVDLLGQQDPENSVSYCGSGVTACHNLLALEHAGLRGGKLYPGSWSEWIVARNRPISKQ